MFYFKIILKFGFNNPFLVCFKKLAVVFVVLAFLCIQPLLSWNTCPELFLSLFLDLFSNNLCESYNLWLCNVFPPHRYDSSLVKNSCLLFSVFGKYVNIFSSLFPVLFFPHQYFPFFLMWETQCDFLLCVKPSVHTAMPRSMWLC